MGRGRLTALLILAPAGSWCAAFGSSVQRCVAGEQMPAGMFRKYEKHASSLADPSGHLHSTAILLSSRIVPRLLFRSTRSPDTHCQQRLVPVVEDVLVRALERADEFDLRLADGQLPGELRSHSSVHRDLSHIKDRDVQPG